MSKKRGKSKKKKKHRKKSRASTADGTPASSEASESPIKAKAASDSEDADASEETSASASVSPDDEAQEAEASTGSDEDAAVAEPDAAEEVTAAHEATSEPPKASQGAAPPKPAGKDSWNPIAVGFNGLGVLIASALFLFGAQKTFQVFDMLWLHHLGETTGYVVDVDTQKGPKGKTIYLTTVQLEKMGSFPKAKVKVADKRLYDYVRYRYHPPRQLRLSVVRVQRKLSGQAAIAKAGPLRLIRPPKSADLILGLGLAIMGLALCFASIRDLRKRWLRRGLLR